VCYNQNRIHVGFSGVSRITQDVNRIISTGVSIFCTGNLLKCNMKINTVYLSHGKINLTSKIHGTFDVSGIRRRSLWLIANICAAQIFFEMIP